jgi:Peptidase C13 family
LSRAIVRIACLVVAAAWLGGCAVPATSQQQAPLFAAQQPPPPTPAQRHHLFYIGLALWPESWSENDVVELAEELRQTAAFDVEPLIASNFVESTTVKYPPADDRTIATMISATAHRAAPGDLVFVHISTHGARGVLAREVDDRPPTAITAQALARQLAPLAGQRTIIVLSACYSGSLIGALRAPDRIIITAARADRSSFGCAAGNRHTWFGEAELRGFAEQDRSLRQIFAAIRGDVAHMEREQRVMPSEPQISVGEDVNDLYEAPMF